MADYGETVAGHVPVSVEVRTVDNPSPADSGALIGIRLSVHASGQITTVDLAPAAARQLVEAITERIGETS